MYTEELPVVSAPKLHRTMPSSYSLGVPIEAGSIQVGTATDKALNSVTRLSVVGIESLVDIEREDEVPLQAVAYDSNAHGLMPIFLEPVKRLTVARVGDSDTSTLWTPVNDGVQIASSDGFKQFLNVVANQAYYKKMTNLNKTNA